MRSRSAWMPTFAAAFFVAVAAGGASAAPSAGTEATTPAIFGEDAGRDIRHLEMVSPPGSARNRIGRAGVLENATQVAQCRRRRSRGGRSRSGSVASPTIVKIPGAKTAPKPTAEFSETAGTGGYYDENGVFHGDAGSGNREPAQE